MLIYPIYFTSAGNRIAPNNAAMTVDMIIDQPADINDNAGIQCIKLFMAIAMVDTTKTGLDFFNDGTSRPINIAYNAIPILDFSTFGSISPAAIPTHVPEIHDTYDIVFKPIINHGSNLFSFLTDATANVSSVIPNAIRLNNFFDVFCLTFCDKDEDIKK
jgi:hypothetical protein